MRPTIMEPVSFFFLFRFDDSLCVFFKAFLGGGFKYVLCSPQTFGLHDPIWRFRIFFKWVETNHQLERIEFKQLLVHPSRLTAGTSWRFEPQIILLNGSGRPSRKRTKTPRIPPRKLTWNPENDGFFHGKISSFFGGPHFQVVHHVRLTGVYIPQKKNSLRGTFWSRSMILKPGNFGTRGECDQLWWHQFFTWRTILGAWAFRMAFLFWKFQPY